MTFLNFKFTTQELIYMLIALIVIIGVCMWAHTLKRKPRNIIGNSKFFLLFSLILVLASIYFISFKGLNYGLDFTGGTLMELGFLQKPSESILHKTMIEFNLEYSDAVIQLEKETAVSEKNEQLTKVLIRIKQLKSKNQTEETNNLISHLEKKFGKIQVFKTENIGPVIGEELKKKALLAMLVALGIQLIYITVRFGAKMRYGLAADIAMVHDVIIMVGIYAVVGRQIDSPFLAAILTVIGYSVMDSIVIFDRIRENLKLYEKSNFGEVVNISVNQTMTRSVNTLATVILTLFALYFFGGSTLKNFAFALLIGLTSGAYSSIFIASPLIVMFDDYVKNKEQKQTEIRRAQLAVQAQAKVKKFQETQQESQKKKKKR